MSYCSALIDDVLWLGSGELRRWHVGYWLKKQRDTLWWSLNEVSWRHYQLPTSLLLIDGSARCCLIATWAAISTAKDRSRISDKRHKLQVRPSLPFCPSSPLPFPSPSVTSIQLGSPGERCELRYLVRVEPGF